MKVIACIPVKGRIPLVRLTIKRLLEKNGCYKVVCAGDTDAEAEAIISSGGEFVHHANKPLGAKWNATFMRASDFNPDACLFVGSSDWLSSNWIEYLSTYLTEYDMIGKVDFNMAHVRGHSTSNGDIQLGVWNGYPRSSNRHGEAIGIGRMIRREMLEKLNYRPFDPNLDNSMDWSMHQRVLTLNGRIKAIKSVDIQSLSLSCDEWINKHNFVREMSGSNADEICYKDEWLERWGFEEIYDFHKNNR